MFAYVFAKFAHGSINQKRKYSGDDYIVHPERVVEILKKFNVGNLKILEAGYLHDVLEDVFPKNPEYSPKRILHEFGEIVLGYVQELTDVYIPENYPKMNRENRKKKEAERLALISEGAKMIKLADLIDNTSDIVKNDPDFAVVYLQEKEQILALMKPSIDTAEDDRLQALYKHCCEQLANAKQVLDQERKKKKEAREFLETCKHGVIAYKLTTDKDVIDVIHFVGYQTKPTDEIIQQVGEELNTDIEFGLVGRINVDVFVMEADTEIIKLYKEAFNIKNK